jgi:Cu(I)/Ag(I) efflux system protein CusF
MKRTTPTLILFAAIAVLAACSPKASTETTAAPPAPAPMPATMPAAALAAPDASATETKLASGTGVVNAVDAKAGTVTLDHQPIPAISWPAMTMTFKASPAIVASVKPGDKVAFDMKLVGGDGEITAIHKQ